MIDFYEEEEYDEYDDFYDEDEYYDDYGEFYDDTYDY